MTPDRGNDAHRCSRSSLAEAAETTAGGPFYPRDRGASRRGRAFSEEAREDAFVARRS
jgi:hypothetical protein